MVYPPGLLRRMTTSDDANSPVSHEDYLWYRWAYILNLDAKPQFTVRIQSTYNSINSSVSFAEHARRSSVHEAAHAVVSVAFGMRVTALYLEDDNSGGCLTVSEAIAWAHKAAQLDLLQSQAAKAVAGHVVEERVWSFARIAEPGLYRTINTFLRHMQNNYPNLETMGVPFASSITDLSERDRLVLNIIENGELNAGLVIDNDADSIHDVAKLLLQHRRLSEGELERLNSSINRREFQPLTMNLA